MTSAAARGILLGLGDVTAVQPVQVEGTSIRTEVNCTRLCVASSRKLDDCRMKFCKKSSHC